MTHDVFISYSSKEKKMAIAACHAMESSKIRCWMAPRDLTGGVAYGDIIVEAIKAAKICVVIFSEAANLSRWVQSEVRTAFDSNLIILPFKIDNTVPRGQMEIYLGGQHWIDACPEPEQFFSRLCTDIQSLLEGRELHPQAYPKMTGRVKRKRSLKFRLAVAAAVLIPVLAGLGIWQYSEAKQRRYHEAVTRIPSETVSGLYEDALVSCRRAQTIIPTDSIAQKAEMLETLISAFAAYSRCEYGAADTLFRLIAGRSADANYFLGEMHYEGLGVTKSFQTGFARTKEADRLGSLMAKYRLGEIYRYGGIGDGDDVKQNDGRAKDYFRSVVDAMSAIEHTGNPEWQYILGNMYREGNGVPASGENAAKHYKTAAGQNYPPAQYALYEILNEQSPDEAKEWLVAAAERGYPKAEFELGVSFISQGDYKNGYEWLLRAVRRNYPPAISQLASFYAESKNPYRDSIPRDEEISKMNLDYNKIVHYYTEKNLNCDEDDYTSMYWMGEDFRTGTGVGKNDSVAWKYFEKAKTKIRQLPYREVENKNVYDEVKYPQAEDILYKIKKYEGNKKTQQNK